MGPVNPTVLEQMKKMQEPPPTTPNLFPRHFPSAEERLLDKILDQQNTQFRENQEVQLQIAQTLKQLITDISNATKASNRFSTWVVIIAALTLLASVFLGGPIFNTCSSAAPTYPQHHRKEVRLINVRFCTEDARRSGTAQIPRPERCKT